MNNRETELRQELENILQILIKEYAPEKIILFGSLANNTVQEWSDLDVVIVKNTPKPFLQRLRDVALCCRPRVGVDFLVYTPDEFAKMIGDGNPFIVEEVLGRGKVLYESRPGSTMA